MKSHEVNPLPPFDNRVRFAHSNSNEPTLTSLQNAMNVLSHMVVHNGVTFNSSVGELIASIESMADEKLPPKGSIEVRE